MKRLLAYLFIILGLGLTFNVNADAKELQICLNHLSKDNIQVIRYKYSLGPNNDGCRSIFKSDAPKLYKKIIKSYSKTKLKFGGKKIYSLKKKDLEDILVSHNINSSVWLSPKNFYSMKEPSQKQKIDKYGNIYLERKTTSKERQDFYDGKIRFYQCVESEDKYISNDDCISNYKKKSMHRAKTYFLDIYFIRDYTGAQIAKTEPSQTQKMIGIPKNLIGSYEGKNNKGYPFKLNINTNKYGEIVGNYSYEANNKIYGGPLYEGELIDNETLKIFWTEGDTNGWFKFKFQENFAKLDGDWGFIENNKELPKRGKYKGVKVNTAIVKKTQKEKFQPENKDIDNEAPVIEIAQNITVDSQTYTLKGKVKDKSRFQLTIDDRPIKVAKNGQFEFEGFAIDTKEQLKIVAIDRWKNKSEKVINVEVKIKQVADLRSYEKPNPSKITVKKDNNKIGIIIGIEKYQNLNNIDAPYANRDAKAFKAYANIALGIPNNNLKVLIDEDATRGELLKSLKIWLPQITRGKEKDIYIFFAGHGLASDNGEDLHILPHNGDPILLEDTALSRVEMFNLINKVNPKSVTMFFDTCYSGQTRSEQMLIAGLRPVRIVADEQDAPNNFTIFTASNYDQTSGSINEAEHGIFSYYLMKGLEGKADENSDKKITNGELISYLKNKVTQEAFSQNRSQEPMLSGDRDKVLISYR